MGPPLPTPMSSVGKHSSSYSKFIANIYRLVCIPHTYAPSSHSASSSFSPSSASGSYKLPQPRSPGQFNRPHDSQCKNGRQKPPPVSGSTDMKSDPFLLRLTYQLSHFCARGELWSCCPHTPSCSNAVLLCKPLWTSSVTLSEVLSIPIGGFSLPS